VAAESWIIWLTEQGGESFLGLAPAERPGDRRFCVLGKLESDGPNGVGVWIDVDFVQEIAIPTNTTVKTWEVNPRSCLVLWGYVAYVTERRVFRESRFRLQQYKVARLATSLCALDHRGHRRRKS
jgi:hypothetical protein